MDELRLRRPEDFMTGNLYYLQHETDPTRFLITSCNGKADEDRIKGRYLTNFDGAWELSKWEMEPYVTSRPSRLATVEEVLWYTACIRENKFIPKDKALILLKPKEERVIPTEKSYVITEHQLHTIHDLSSPVIKEMLENWYTPEMFCVKTE